MPIAGDENDPAPRTFRRELGLEFSKSNLEDLPGGGLLIRGVKLLAEGTWTDSATRTPLAYRARALEANAGNWKDYSAWSRHAGGIPRDITEKIGAIENPRYLDRAVAGDIRLHGLTQRSRDTVAMVKGGVANYVSVEHTGTERWNAETRQYEADEITFYGVAIVNRGACAACTLRGNEGAPEEGETDMELKELEAALKAATDKIAALESQAATAETKVKELEAALTPAEDPKVKELEKALADQRAAHETKVRELEAAIKKLGDGPGTPATQPPGETRELEPPAPVQVDPHSGVVYGL